jgi:DNA-binding SARP family transcriptional activator
VQGNRAEALQVYDELRSLLREELGAAPSPATQDQHRTLLK